MKIFAFIAGCACALAAVLPASAQVLMVDFGPTTATAGSLTNSPYHTVNTGFTDTAWNTVGTADVAAGALKWSDNTTATGVSLNLGATTTDLSTTVGLANTPSGSTLSGSSLSSGVYADTAPGRDGIFTGTNGTNVRYLGMQIGGLAAGTYDIYITGRNTNTTTGQTHAFYAGKSSSSGDFDVSNNTVFATQSVSFFAEPTTQEDAWSGSGGLANYAKFTVTLTSGEYLNLAAHGTSGDLRGFVNLVQIVNTAAVPEPSAFAALLGAFALLGATFARRR